MLYKLKCVINYKSGQNNATQEDDYFGKKNGEYQQSRIHRINRNDSVKQPVACRNVVPIAPQNVAYYPAAYRVCVPEKLAVTGYAFRYAPIL